MAEEQHLHFELEPTHDDATVMKQLLQTVKGLSPVSTVPALVPIGSDSVSFDE